MISTEYKSNALSEDVNTISRASAASYNDHTDRHQKLNKDYYNQSRQVITISYGVNPKPR